MNINTFLTVIVAYPVIKEIYRDIHLIFKEKDKREQRYTLWKQNRKDVFLYLFLFISSLLLFIASIAVSIGSISIHNTFSFIIFSFSSALFLYYGIILLFFLITKIALILVSKNKR